MWNDGVCKWEMSEAEKSAHESWLLNFNREEYLAKLEIRKVAEELDREKAAAHLAMLKEQLASFRRGES